MNESEGTVELHTFFDAIAAGSACGQLEEAEIPFTVKDWGVPSQGIHKFAEPPAIQLQILVKKDDLKRAQDLLRNTLQLFPEREVGDTSPLSMSEREDEVRTQVAACESMEDATALVDALKQANISSNIRKLNDEDDSGWISYSVEVEYEDIDRAFRAIERWAQ